MPSPAWPIRSIPNPQSGIVYSIAIAGGRQDFSRRRFHDTIGGQTRNRIARLDGVTGLADSFDPNANVNSLSMQSRSRRTARSWWAAASVERTASADRPRNFFARLSNDTAALQNLAVTRTAITWTRGGSSPQFTRVTFESSTDNVNYTSLGNGTAAGSNWTLTGLSLPNGQNFYIRARGYYRGGYQNGSESITESVRRAFISRVSSFGNISTRLNVQSGDNAMIGGFIITGTQPKTVVVRGLGRSLSVPGALADPTIEVYGPSGELLGTNDNWKTDPDPATDHR